MKSSFVSGGEINYAHYRAIVLSSEYLRLFPFHFIPLAGTLSFPQLFPCAGRRWGRAEDKGDDSWTATSVTYDE